jgi:hypothetical protein
MITKLFLGSAIAAAAISAAAPGSADPDNPFSHLCMGSSHCSGPVPAGVSHSDASQVRAGIRQGRQAVESALPQDR